MATAYEPTAFERTAFAIDPVVSTPAFEQTAFNNDAFYTGQAEVTPLPDLGGGTGAGSASSVSGSRGPSRFYASIREANRPSREKGKPASDEKPATVAEERNKAPEAGLLAGRPDVLEAEIAAARAARTKAQEEIIRALQQQADEIAQAFLYEEEAIVALLLAA